MVLSVSMTKCSLLPRLSVYSHLIIASLLVELGNELGCKVNSGHVVRFASLAACCFQSRNCKQHIKEQSKDAKSFSSSTVSKHARVPQRTEFGCTRKSSLVPKPSHMCIRGSGVLCDIFVNGTEPLLNLRASFKLQKA